MRKPPPCASISNSGLLTDSFTKESIAKFAEDDWRRRSPDFQEPNLSRNLALRDALRPIAQKARDDGIRSRRSLGDRVARGHGSYRRCPIASTGRWLDRRRYPQVDYWRA